MPALRRGLHRTLSPPFVGLTARTRWYRRRLALTLLVGGARSGKSSLAVRLAERSGRAVTFVATAEGLDDEMVQRIARHRTERPAHWTTIEAPIELGAAVDQVPADHVVVVDCLSLWVTNLLLADRSPEWIEAAAELVATSLAARPGPSVVVGNEVGSGIVPMNELARSYRDVLGRVNAVFGAHAAQATLVVAGRVLPLLPSHAMQLD